MKSLAFSIALFFSVSTAFSQAAEGKKEDGLVWHTNLKETQEISNKTNKPIFAFFTGSDWCGWCHKLQRDVFAKPEFVSWAKKNVVLLELDFPRGKQLTPELVQQNNALQQQFGVTGYPTIWMFKLGKGNAENNLSLTPLGSLGYPSNSEKGKEEVKFLESANQILSNASKK